MPPTTPPPYVLRLSPGARRVEIGCDSPLQFEAKGWQRAMRTEIRAAVSRLVSGPDDVLTGVYAGPTGSWSVDAENVLFYNVGPGAFAASATRGLRFERVHGASHGLGPDRRFEYAVIYELAPIGSEFRYSRRGELLATFDAVGVGAAAGTPSASEVWAGLRDALATNGAVRVGRAGLYGGALVLELRVTSPAPSLNAASVLKPLVDGVVAAFSLHDGADLDGVSRRISEQIGRAPDGVARALTEPSAVLLGTQRLVVCRSRGVQWLPPDDRLVACQLLVESDPTARWRVSGSLSVGQPLAASRAAKS